MSPLLEIFEEILFSVTHRRVKVCAVSSVGLDLVVVLPRWGQTPSRVLELGDPKRQPAQAPRQGHRAQGLGKHRQLVFGLSHPKTSSGKAMQPRAGRGRTRVVRGIRARPAQTLLWQLCPDPAGGAETPPDLLGGSGGALPGAVTGGREKSEKSRKAGQWEVAAGEGPPAIHSLLSSITVRPQHRGAGPGAQRSSGTAPTLPELFDIHLLQTKQHELLFY